LILLFAQLLLIIGVVSFFNAFDLLFEAYVFQLKLWLNQTGLFCVGADRGGSAHKQGGWYDYGNIGTGRFDEGVSRGAGAWP
jgi:hypothetical protein